MTASAKPAHGSTQAPGLAPARRPLLRGRLHQLALLGCPPAFGYLYELAGSALVRASVVIYGLTTMLVYAASSAYHRGSWRPAARRQLRRLDHAAIFLFCGGSYTLFAVLVLPMPARTAFLTVVWALVVAGVHAKDNTLDRLRGPGDYWYPVCGWAGLLALPWIAELPAGDVALLLGGGAVASLGAAVMVLRRPDPFPGVFGYHEVGHLVTFLGSACHYLLFVFLLRAGR